MVSVPGILHHITYMHIAAANSSTVILPDVSFLIHPKICGLIHSVIRSPPRFLGKIHHCCQTPHQYCWNLRVWAGGYRKGWKHTELTCYLFTESSCFWDQTSLFFSFCQGYCTLWTSGRLLQGRRIQQVTFLFSNLEYFGVNCLRKSGNGSDSWLSEAHPDEGIHSASSDLGRTIFVQILGHTLPRMPARKTHTVISKLSEMLKDEIRWF